MPSLQLENNETLLCRFKCRMSRPKIGKCSVYVTSLRVCWFKKSLLGSEDKSDRQARPPSLQLWLHDLEKFFFSQPQFMFKLNLRKRTSTATPHSELIFKLSGDKDVKERQFEELRSLLTDILAQNQHKTTTSGAPCAAPPSSGSKDAQSEAAIVSNARKRARESAQARLKETMDEHGAPSERSSKAVRLQSHTAGTSTAVLSFAERRSILSSKLDMQRSFEELVLSGAMNEEEFWKTYQAQQNSTSRGNDAGGAADSTSLDTPTHIRLDASTIRGIFVKHPKVFERFQRKVPGEMTESEFWSEYFHAVAFRDANASAIVSLNDAAEGAAQTGSELASAATTPADREEVFDTRFDLRDSESDFMLPLHHKLQQAESSESGTKKAPPRKRLKDSSAILGVLNQISAGSLAADVDARLQRQRLVRTRHCFPGGPAC